MFTANQIRYTLGIIGVMAILYFFSGIVSWIVIAYVLSLLGLPIMKLLGKIRIRKWQLGAGAKSLLTIIFFYFMLGLLLLLFIPPVLQQARNLSNADYKSFSKSLTRMSDSFMNRLEKAGLSEKDKPATKKSTPRPKPLPPNTSVVRIDSLLMAAGDSTHANTPIILNIQVNTPETRVEINAADTLVKAGDSPTEQLKKKVFKFFNPSALFEFFGGLLNTLTHLLVALVSITFLLFFFLKDPLLFENAVLAFIPTHREQDVRAVLDRIQVLLMRYFLGILLEIAGVTLFVWVGLTLFGIPNALLIAFVAALLNIIPYVGIFIASAFGAILTLTANLEADFFVVTLPMILKLVFLIGIAHIIDAYLLQPIIYSKSVMAHPLEIFVIVLVGAELSGIMGMVLAVPVYTVGRVIAAEFFENSKVVRSLTRRMNEELEDDE